MMPKGCYLGESHILYDDLVLCVKCQWKFNGVLCRDLQKIGYIYLWLWV